MNESVSTKISTGTLHGTLIVPETSGPIPVVLVIAGSGPTDRDGNSTKMKRGNNSLRLLSEGLAGGGIASLRYDKRGVGESQEARGREEETVFGDMVRDAESWIALLKNDGRFSAIHVAGHSEGSLIGMIAAQHGGADGFISLEGAGRPIDQVLTEQMRRQPKFIRRRSEQILTALRRGETVERVSFLLKGLYRPQIQPYIRSWMAYDPAEELAKLTVPALIVQGGRDIQTTKADFEALVAARRDAITLYLDEMNHVLKECGPGLRRNIATYTNPALPLASGLLGGVAEFVLTGGRDAGSTATKP